MNYWDFLAMVFRNIISLPVKGIIYAEEQFLQWHIVLGGVYLQQMIPTIIMILAIYFVVMTVVFNRQHPFHGHHHGGNILRHIWRFIVTILFAWFFLLYGVIAGNNEQAQRNATTTYTYRRHGPMFDAARSFTRMSLHFRLGRWLYNTLFRLLGHIPFISRNARVHRGVTLTIVLVICLWGVWRIPYDLTH